MTIKIISKDQGILLCEYEDKDYELAYDQFIQYQNFDLDVEIQIPSNVESLINSLTKLNIQDDSKNEILKDLLKEIKDEIESH